MSQGLSASAVLKADKLKFRSMHSQTLGPNVRGKEICDARPKENRTNMADCIGKNRRKPRHHTLNIGRSYSSKQ